MNDEQLIDRLRTALDEVHAITPVPATTQTHRNTRWLAIAAATVLVLGALAALAVRRGHDAPAADTVSSNDTVPSEVSTSDTLTPSGQGSWYTLSATDLVPGELTVQQCCLPHPAPGPQLALAWGDAGGLDHGLLLLTVTNSDAGEPPVLEFAHAAMTDERAAALAAQVVPGSGLPYVLPDPSMQLLGNGLVSDGFRADQTYTVGDERVELSVGDYRGQLDLLATGVPLTVTTVAGQTAYRFEVDGVTWLVWRTPAGTWGTLAISPGLADRADAIIGGVSATSLPTVAETPPLQEPGSTTEYETTATVIETPGNPPMIAFALLESLPPQGGDIPLRGFTWATADGEQTANGTTWGGPYVLRGVWDGTTFTLTAPPAPVTGSSDQEPVMTEGCTLATMAPMLDALSALDMQTLHIVSTSSWNFDGHCGVKVTAAFDTPELRAATDAVGDDVTLEFMFRPVAP